MIPTNKQLIISTIIIFGIANTLTCAANGTFTDNKLLKSDKPEYEYTIEGRQDPFRPFLSPKAATPTGLDPNEIINEPGELSGMQLFEPGQLTLAGVLFSNNDHIALVEDQTKKGYLIKIGTLIGRRGLVSDIDKSQVTITETAKTRAGKEIQTTIIMKLNKEDEK